jgi:hypothetical protein
VPAPIIVTAILDALDQAWFDRRRAEHFPPERNVLSAHLTMFHHLPPLLETELRQRLGEIAKEGAITVRIGALVSLGEGVAYRIDSPELEGRCGYLADMWSDLLTPQDRAPWRPHVTIQNKVKPFVAKTLLDRLAADFRPRPLAITGFSSWRYRGGPWEPLSCHMCA